MVDGNKPLWPRIIANGDLPKSGRYLTDLGWRYYYTTMNQWRLSSNVGQTYHDKPKFWFSEDPPEHQVRILQEASDEFCTNFNYDTLLTNTGINSRIGIKAGFEAGYYLGISTKSEEKSKL